MAVNTNTKAAALTALKDLVDSLDHLKKLYRVEASPRPAAASPKPAGPPVRLPSTAIPSPAKPVVQPRPAVNATPMPDSARRIEDAAAVVVRHTLQAGAMVLSRVLGRPEPDMLKALAAEVHRESARGADFATALNRAKSTIAAGIRAGLA